MADPPGLRRELIIALIKSLPKPVRRNFVPAPNYAGKRFLGLGGAAGTAAPFAGAQAAWAAGVTMAAALAGGIRCPSPENLPGGG
ncbi:DUF3418 domain-containing protein [Klebsiella pneumoniae]|nr:DUF3418 domain-containing protein [Klebsiella pneumoniae]